MDQNINSQNQDAVQNSEERTYKGVVFATVEDKNNIIVAEQEAAEYIKTMNQHSYVELLQKKNHLMALPNVIFADYIVAIITEMGAKEKIEVRSCEERIASASLDELNNIREKIINIKYSIDATNYLLEKIEQKRYACQNQILEELTANYTEIDRQQLRALSKTIAEKQFHNNLTTQYIQKISMQYDIVEQRELAELCNDYESKNIDEISAVITIIKEREYQEKFSAQYVQKLYNRIDLLHRQNLEAICTDVANMERAELDAVKVKVDEERCREEIKAPFYQMIAGRAEVLDYNDLVELTNDADQKNLEQLSELYKELNTGKYNPKFINEFMLKVRLLLEKAQYEYVMSLVDIVEKLDKETVLDVASKVNETGYEERILRAAKQKIDDRLFELDMKTLLGVCNDFDSLGMADIESLYAQVNQLSISQRSHAVYTERIAQRALSLALEDTSPYAALFQSLLARYALSFENLIVANQLPYFINPLNQFKADFGVNDIYEVPIFIMNGATYFAISKNYCYFRTDTGYMKQEISNVHSFANVKKFLFEGLAVNLKNGTQFLVKGTINKKVLAVFIQCLNEFLMYINNPNVIGQFKKLEIKTDSFNASAFDMPNTKYGLNIQDTINRMVTGNGVRAGLFDKFTKNLFFVGNEEWIAKERKVVENFGIHNDNTLICCYDSTMLNTAKEGFAIGKHNVYIKRSGQPLIALPIETIYNVEADGISKIITFTAKDNSMFKCSISFSEPDKYVQFGQKVNEYIKEMQIIYFMFGKEEVVESQPPVPPVQPQPVQPQQPEMVQPQQMQKPLVQFCTNCGARLEADMRFCTKCGARVD